MKFYSAEGSVRGRCGHQHRTLDAAEKCLRSDQNGCRSVGGFSDREVILRNDNGEEFCLSCSEPLRLLRGAYPQIKYCNDCWEGGLV